MPVNQSSIVVVIIIIIILFFFTFIHLQNESRHLARASLPVELRIHCVKLRTLEKCNSSSSVLFLL